MNEDETVEQFLTTDEFQTLSDFAYFMLGKCPKSFCQSCHVRKDQDPKLFTDCWTVYNEWQDWRADEAQGNNS